MALEGPRLARTRIEQAESELERALRLAREVEDLLEGDERGRMARAMASSLVGELEALVRGLRASSFS